MPFDANTPMQTNNRVRNVNKISLQHLTVDYIILLPLIAAKIGCARFFHAINQLIYTTPII